MDYKNLIKKVVIFLVVAFVLITLLGLWGPKVASWWNKYEFNLKVKQAEDMARVRENAYRSDVIGGKTPEETFDIFLVALKEGNTLQASRYYELSVQLQALNNLQGELAKNGNLQKSIDYFTEVRTKGVKQCNEKGDGCTWRFTGLDGYDRLVDIGVNQLSHVWKIIQPL